MLKFLLLIFVPSILTAHSYYRYQATAELLYWQAQENGQAIALTEKGTIKNPDFEWDVGFRIALGYLIPHDHWDVQLSWTHLNTDAHSNHKGVLFPTWSINAPELVNEVKLHWRLHLGIVDLDLAKELRVGQCFLIKPLIGIRTAVIRQKEYIYYWEPGENRVSMKDKFWGMGLKGGINFIWLLTHGFGFTLDTAFSQVFGEFHLHQAERIPDKVLNVHNRYHQSTSIIDLAAGLFWSYTHYTLKAAWENHLYMAQNQLLHFTGNRKFFANQGDISLQGATLSFQYAF